MINKGEIGVTISVDFGSDISNAISALLILEPEVGKAKEFTATINGQVGSYTTISEEDLNFTGRWRKKLKVTFSNTSVLQSDYEVFRVLN